MQTPIKCINCNLETGLFIQTDTWDKVYEQLPNFAEIRRINIDQKTELHITLNFRAMKFA